MLVRSPEYDLCVWCICVCIQAAKERCAELMGSSLDGLESKKWNEKVAALTEIKDKITEKGADIADYTDPIVYYLNKTPSFKGRDWAPSEAVPMMCVCVCVCACECKYLTWW